MKLAAAFFGMTCFAAFAQENAAGDAIQKRIEGMDLLHPPQRMILITRKAPAVGSGLCSIPLLNALPADAGARGPMPVLSPHDPGDRNNVRVPAPECK
jgi:hypothetical protein